MDEYGSRSSNTSFNYRSRYRAELLGVPEGYGEPQELRLTRPDGTYLRYEFHLGWVEHYRLVAFGAVDGTEHVIGYDEYGRASTLTMADGLQTTVEYGQVGDGQIRPVRMLTSDGRQVLFGYGERDGTFPDNRLDDIDQPFPVHWNLTSMTDPAGVRSEFNYVFDPTLQTSVIQEVVTPYGKTTITVEYPDSGYVAKLVKVTRPDGNVEAWARLTEDADYPAFSAVPQVNTNSLDILERGARNTVHWNAQQYAIVSLTSPANWNYTNFVRGTTKHWLALSGAQPTHFDTLSWEQLPSPTGLTNTPGAVTWYDYDGKPTDANGIIRHERGTNSVMPSLIARLMPDGTTWSQSFVRNAVGNPLSATERWHDGTGYQTRTQTWTYETTGNLATSHVDALGRTNTFEYTSARLSRQENALGEAMEWTHDAAGRVTERTLPSGQRFATSYSASTSAGQTNGWTVTTVEYFGTNAVSTNVVVETWNVTLPWTYRGGVSSNIATVRVVATDRRGLVTTNFSDGLGRLVESRSSAGTVRLHHELRAGSSYANGTGALILDRTLIESPLGITNETIHDVRRRPIYQVDSHGVTNATTYCECGSPSQVTAALGIAGIARTTSFDYDYQGRLWRTTLPAGTVLTNYYDVSGRLVVMQDPSGYATNVYDNLNRLTARYSAAGLLLSQSYDLADRVIIQTDASGVTVTNSYDGLGRLKTLHRAGSATPVLAYGYTAGLAPATTETNAVGSIRTMHFDSGQRLTAEVQVGLWTNSFAYLPSGDLKHLDDGRGNRTEWKYDPFGRVKEKWYQGQTNADLVYSYDAVGRLTNRFSRTGNPGTNGYNTVYAYEVASISRTVG
jgi:YD repeat-containing protein